MADKADWLLNPVTIVDSVFQDRCWRMVIFGSSQDVGVKLAKLSFPLVGSLRLCGGGCCVAIKAHWIIGQIKDFDSEFRACGCDLRNPFRRYW
ncbi:hypothetical protein D3C80_1768180 [compost metagenome]